MAYKRIFVFNTDWLEIPLGEFEKNLNSSLKFIDGFKSLKCRTEPDESIPDINSLLIEIESENVENMAVIAIELGFILTDYVSDWLDFEHSTLGYDEMQIEKKEQNKTE